MDEVRKERLMVAGIDVNGTLERFMGNEALLEQMLNKFKDDTHFQKLLEAAKQLNGDEGLSFSHTLKGMCGNLGMTELYELLTARCGYSAAAILLMLLHCCRRLLRFMSV